MKEVNKASYSKDIKKLAIDLGSANLKIAGSVNGEMVFKKIKSLATTDSIDDNYVVSIDDNTIYFGTGNSLIQQDKTKREYIEETILLSVYQIYGEIESSFRIDLALGLPLDLYKTENKREEFEAKVRSLQSKVLFGCVNGHEITVKLNSVSVFAEGYSAFISLHEKMDTESPFMVVDIGYRTTDVLSVDIDNEGELTIGNYTTVNYGMLEIFEDIKKAFMNDTGSTMPVSSVESRILFAPKVKVGNSKTVNIKDWVKYGRNTVGEIFKQIHLKFPDLPNRNVYLVGGGSMLVDEIVKHMVEENMVEFDTQTVGTQDELLYCNVAGYFMQLED